MHAYSPADWQSFYVAVVGAAAALTGLLFVAVSINLANILKEDSMLPTRAAETLGALLFVMVAAALTLVPVGGISGAVYSAWVLLVEIIR
jgi:hypothetical protein